MHTWIFITWLLTLMKIQTTSPNVCIYGNKSQGQHKTQNARPDNSVIILKYLTLTLTVTAI